MNKQNALTLLFTSLFISQNIHTQEKPKGPGSSRKTHPHSSKVNSALETFGAVTCSDDIEELPSDFCKATLKRVPEKYKKRIKILIGRQAKSKFSGHIILHGPTGSGKSTLAQVILQEIGAPYLIVNGSMVANEFQNSGVSGIRRICDFAIQEKSNICIDEMDSVSQVKSKKNEYQREDETPKAFWEALDKLRKHNLLLIGTTNDLSNMPPQLRKRLKKNIFEIPYINQIDLIKGLISSILAQHNASLESAQSIDDASKMFKNEAIRDINDIVSLAIENVQEDNAIAPVITLTNIKKAWQEIAENEKLLATHYYDKKEIFNYTVQTVGAIASTASIIGTIYSIRNGYISLELAKRVAEFNVLNADRMYQLGLDSKQIAAASLELAKSSQEIAKKGLAIQKITSSVNIASVAAGAIALVASSSCTIS